MIVPYIAKEKIEEEAEHLLNEAYKGLGITLDGPVDIESIIECYLELSISIATLDPGILGALYLAEKLVEINEDILPYNDKRRTGVFNFTLAHEGGHYILHAPLLAANSQNLICRKNEEYVDREWQANFFASSLLMPKKPFTKAWRGSVWHKPNGQMIMLSQLATMKNSVCSSIGKYELVHNNSVIHTEIEELKVRIYDPKELMEILKSCGFKVRRVKAFEAEAAPNENDEAVVYECRKF